jgi:membrane protein
MKKYLKKIKRLKSLRSRLSAFPERQTWREIALKTWDRLFEDEVFGRSAQLAYYWLFSLFPLLILLTGLLAFSPLFSNLNRWLNLMDSVLPPQAFALVKTTSYEIISQQQHGLLSFSFLVVLWASSSGMGAVITSLNKAFNASQSRPWWKERLLAILLTLGLTFFIIIALMLIFFGDQISALVARAYDFGSIFTVIWNTGQWLVVILFVLLGVELIYYFAPNIKQRWEFFTPGAMFALVLWLLISFVFRFYVSHFANYNAFYGALGSVMVLMLWLYLTSVAILVGGVINSITRSRRH